MGARQSYGGPMSSEQVSAQDVTEAYAVNALIDRLEADEEMKALVAEDARRIEAGLQPSGRLLDLDALLRDARA